MMHPLRTLVVLIALTLLAPLAWAHQSIVVGEQFRVTVGFVHNPAYAGILNHLDLIVRTSESEPQFVPTIAGNYSFRVWGFIGEVAFDEVFDRFAHSDPFVADPASISLP
jgi:hypothetical protein